MFYFMFTPCPRSGAAAMRRCPTSKVRKILVGTGAAMRRYPTSKGKGEALARW